MLNEEHVLNLFDNRELRNVFGPKKEDLKCAGEDASQNISIIRGIKYRINRTGLCGTFGSRKGRKQDFCRKTREKEKAWKDQAYVGR